MLKKILLVLTLILIVTNFYIIGEYSTYDRRVFNLISLCCYFVLFLLAGCAKDILLLYSILAFIGTDTLLFYYDSSEIITKVIPVLKISAFYLLTVSILNKVKLLSTRKPVVIFFIIVMSLNLLWMFNLIWAISDTINDKFELILFLLYAIVLVVISTIAIICYLKFKTKRSLYFLIFIISLVLSDTTWFIAYYFNYQLFFYLYSVSYFIALSFMILYAENINKDDDAFITEIQIQ